MGFDPSSGFHTLQFLSHLWTIPRVPTTIGFTVTLMFHSFFNSRAVLGNFFAFFHFYSVVRRKLKINQISHKEQCLDYREAEELCWCPSWSNSLWQEWSCGLVYCPAGNATDPIWRVLTSSLGISSWTPLKPLHSNPNPNPLANQLWSIDFLTPPTPLIIPHRLRAFIESLLPLKNWDSIHARWSKSSRKHSIRFCGGIFSKFKTILKHIVLLKSQIAFLKFPCYDNQALVRCIPIAAVAFHLNLKSYKLVSHLIRCIAIRYWIFKSLRQY